MSESHDVPLTRVAPDAQPHARPRSEEILRLLRVRLPIVVIVAALSALTAWILASRQPAVYRATAIAAVAPLVDKLPVGDQVRGVEALDRRTIVATAAALASTPETIQSGLEKTGIAKGSYVIRAIPLPNTNLLRVEVEDSDPARAATIANRVPPIVGQQTIAIFKFFDLRVVSPAVAGVQIAPRATRAAAAGVVLGLFLGTAVAWAIEKLRADATRAA
jgi:hypothetical protein